MKGEKEEEGGRVGRSEKVGGEEVRKGSFVTL